MSHTRFWDIVGQSDWHVALTRRIEFALLLHQVSTTYRLLATDGLRSGVEVCSRWSKVQLVTGPFRKAVFRPGSHRWSGVRGRRLQRMVWSKVRLVAGMRSEAPASLTHRATACLLLSL